MNGESFAYPCSENAEVLEVNGNSFTAQGTGKVQFICGKNGQQKTVIIDFTNELVQTVEF